MLSLPSPGGVGKKKSKKGWGFYARIPFYA